MRRQPTILLTGFGPFPGVPENASALLASRLAHLAARRFPAHRVVARVLPTEWVRAPAYLSQIYLREQPDLALHFGVSERATGFVIELRARNVRGSAADAKGVVADGSCVDERGPAHLPAQVPAEEIVARLRALGLPAQLSDDAGTYLCNTAFFHALGITRARGDGPRVGFVHVPSRLAAEAPSSGAGETSALLTWEGMLQGGLEIVRACLGRPPTGRVKAR